MAFINMGLNSELISLDSNCVYVIDTMGHSKKWTVFSVLIGIACGTSMIKMILVPLNSLCLIIQDNILKVASVILRLFLVIFVTKCSLE